MTKSPSSPPWTTATKAVVAVSALALTVLVIWRFQDLIQPLVLALLLAYLLHPVISLISQRTGMSGRSWVAPKNIRESCGAAEASRSRPAGSRHDRDRHCARKVSREGRKNIIDTVENHAAIAGLLRLDGIREASSATNARVYVALQAPSIVAAILIMAIAAHEPAE